MTQPAPDPQLAAITALIGDVRAAQDKAAKYGATWYALARARTELIEARMHAAAGD